MNWKWLPWSLVAFRGASAAALLFDSLDRSTSWWFVPLFAAAFISDIFDGMAARRLGVVTPQLRKADGIIDTLLYLVMAGAAVSVFGHRLLPLLGPALLLLLLQISLQVFSRIKHGKGTSFHGWSAKLWGLTIAVGAVGLFGFSSFLPLWICFAAGVVNTIEEAAMVWALPQWEHDVWSLKSALQIRSSTQAPESDLPK